MVVIISFSATAPFFTIATMAPRMAVGITSNERDIWVLNNLNTLYDKIVDHIGFVLLWREPLSSPSHLPPALVPLAHVLPLWAHDGPENLGS
jgi:hypothetical protein